MDSLHPLSGFFWVFTALGISSPGTTLAITSLIAVVVLVVRIAFAIGVHRDASRRHGSLFFVGPKVWALAVLVIGLPAAVTYWVLHHSTFRATS